MRRVRLDLRLRGKFVLWVGFVLLGGVILLGVLALPRFDAAGDAWFEIGLLEDLRVESREVLELREVAEPLDIGIATLHMNMPVGDNLHKSEVMSMLNMWWDDGTRLTLTDWYRPKRREFRSASTEGHIPAEEMIAFAEGPRPGLIGLVFSGRDEIARWGRLARELRLGSYSPSGTVHILETGEGLALVSCAKDDYVGRPERAYALRGRWWAADGSMSFAFTFSWPEGEEPFEEEPCLERARDLVSRMWIARPGEDPEGADEPHGVSS